MSNFDDDDNPEVASTNNSKENDETDANRVLSPDEEGNKQNKTSLNSSTNSGGVDPPSMGSTASPNSAKSPASTEIHETRPVTDTNDNHAVTRGTIHEENSPCHESNGTQSLTYDSPRKSLKQPRKSLKQELLSMTGEEDELDIAPASAADTSIVSSIDPDGARHKQQESLLFADLNMESDDFLTRQERESIELSRANSRSPSPLSDACDNPVEPDEELIEKKAQSFIPDLGTSTQLTPEIEEGEEKKLPDRPLTRHVLETRDPSEGAVLHSFFPESSPMQERPITSTNNNIYQAISPLDTDRSLPPMIYQRTTTSRVDHTTLPIPHLPPLAIGTGQRTGVIAAHLPPQYSHQLQGMPLTNQNPMMMGGGKRKIHLRLIEDVEPKKGKKVSFLAFRRKKKGGLLVSPRGGIEPPIEEPQVLDRGRVTVSWYEGTTSLELYEHVRNSVIRKLELHGTAKLSDLRILDEAFDPPEEIVLSPYIPDGSRLLLRFSTSDKGGDITPEDERNSYNGRAPVSPSAAPSPYPSTLDLNGLGLNPNQLALLGARLQGHEMPYDNSKEYNSKTPKSERNRIYRDKMIPSPNRDQSENSKNHDTDDNDNDTTLEMNSLHPEDQIEKSLRQITELLIADRTKNRYVPRQEKRQVVFVLANYFVLFLSLIAISAEIQGKIPEWHKSIEQHLKNVQSCSKDEDSLYECVSKGDLAGLVASVVLWISRSAATRRIFLFGFESPQKLWTVVYESLVTAFCWGFSYMFIRRGMNPDTSRNFLYKYWKDAVYGSLAGFNAAFMKHVLKNLIPQEAIEDALLQDRKLKILSWLKY